MAHEQLDEFNLIGKNLCKSGDEIDEKYTFFNVFGSSNTCVYSLCKKTGATTRDCNTYLAKIWQIEGWTDLAYVRNEANFMRRASDLGVAPKFIEQRFCKYNDKPHAIIIMEKYGIGDLTKLYTEGYYKENKEYIDSQLKSILDTLYDDEIDHNDLHSNNFLYDLDSSEKPIFKIIDFDSSEALDSSSQRNYKIEIVGSYKTINVNPQKCSGKRCSGFTLKKKRCKKQEKTDGYCHLHNKK